MRKITGYFFRLNDINHYLYIIDDKNFELSIQYQINNKEFPMYFIEIKPHMIFDELKEFVNQPCKIKLKELNIINKLYEVTENEEKNRNAKRT